ncbi:MAG TPA: hypothetical protein VGB84_02565 [Arachidicoccus sp.]
MERHERTLLVGHHRCFGSHDYCVEMFSRLKVTKQILIVKKLLLISSLFFEVLRAQNFTPEIISASGDYVVNSGYSLSYTVGEMTMVKTASSSSFILTQGFHQSEKKA